MSSAQFVSTPSPIMFKGNKQQKASISKYFCWLVLCLLLEFCCADAAGVICLFLFFSPFNYCLMLIYIQLSESFLLSFYLRLSYGVYVFRVFRVKDKNNSKRPTSQECFSSLYRNKTTYVVFLWSFDLNC